VLYLERQAEGEGREEDRVDDYCNQSVLQQTNDSIVKRVVSTYHASSGSCSVAAAASDLRAEKTVVVVASNDDMRRDAMLCYAMHCYAHCE